MHRIKLEIPAFLEHLTNGGQMENVEGRTVGECLAHFVRRWPQAEKLLFDERGSLLGHIEIYVNGVSAFPDELAKEVKEGDTISMVYLIVGG